MSDKSYNTNLASEFYVLSAWHRLGLDAVLTSRGIVCMRIPESETRTPDYELLCGPERIVVEVKEIARNQRGEAWGRA